MSFLLRLRFSACLIALVVSASDLPRPVPGYPIGRCVRVLGVTAPEDAKTVGFEYIELALQDLLPLSDSEFDLTVKRLKKIGIPLVSGYGFMPADVRIVGPDVKQELIDEHLKRGLSRAAKFGLQYVVYGNLNTASRRAPDGFSSADIWKQLVDFGRRSALEAKKHGITILIEPMPVRSTNTINTVADGLKLVEAVDDPHFQLLVDFSFMTQGKEDMTILHRAAKQIRQVEISNPNGRVYPRSVDEADYRSFFQALKKGGYQGGLSVHGRPDDFFVDAPRAISLLRTLAGGHQ